LIQVIDKMNTLLSGQVFVYILCTNISVITKKTNYSSVDSTNIIYFHSKNFNDIYLQCK